MKGRFDPQQGHGPQVENYYSKLLLPCVSIIARPYSFAEISPGCYSPHSLRSSLKIGTGVISFPDEVLVSTYLLTGTGKKNTSLYLMIFLLMGD